MTAASSLVRVIRCDVPAAVIVVDSDHEVRRHIVEFLGRSGLPCVGASTGVEAIAEARRARPALVLVDVCLPDTNAFEVCRTLRAEFGDDLPIVFMSGQRVEALDRTAGLMLGADDYVVKPFDQDELLARLRRLLERSRGDQRRAERHLLTSRESEVLRLLAAGDRPADIASRLGISPKTVSNHMQRVFTKLNVHSQAQAVAVAYREDLIDLPDVTSSLFAAHVVVG